MSGNEALLRSGAGPESTLASVSVGHDNNLNLLRVIAASLVLVSHSFVLATGDPGAEPWLGSLGTTPGGLAVDIFFAVSGFLVTGSLERTRGLRRFAAARMLRIYPALWLSLILTALMVGLWFTDLSFVQFVQDPQTWRWLGKNAVMLFGGEGALPESFLHVPAAGVVNGSLWTLRWELRCYVLLAALWWAVRLIDRRRVVANFARVTIAVAVALTGLNLALFLAGKPVDYVQLASMFFQGAALWVLRDRILIGWSSFAALGLAYVVGALVSPQAFQLVNAVGLAWFTLHLAFLPGGRLLAYNRLGDYSYGIYIFAFPIQQAAMTLYPGLGGWSLMFAVTLPTLALAVLSWHFIEKRALTSKDRFSRQLEKMF